MSRGNQVAEHNELAVGARYFDAVTQDAIRFPARMRWFQGTPQESLHSPNLRWNFQEFPLDKFGFQEVWFYNPSSAFIGVSFSCSYSSSWAISYPSVFVRMSELHVHNMTLKSRYVPTGFGTPQFVRILMQFDMRYRRRVVQSSRVQSPIRNHPTNKNLRTIERAQFSHSLQSSCPLSTSTFTIPLDTLLYPFRLIEVSVGWFSKKSRGLLMHRRIHNPQVRPLSALSCQSIWIWIPTGSSFLLNIFYSRKFPGKMDGFIVMGLDDMWFTLFLLEMSWFLGTSNGAARSSALHHKGLDIICIYLSITS